MTFARRQLTDRNTVPQHGADLGQQAVNTFTGYTGNPVSGDVRFGLVDQLAIKVDLGIAFVGAVDKQDPKIRVFRTLQGAPDTDLFDGVTRFTPARGVTAGH